MDRGAAALLGSHWRLDGRPLVWAGVAAMCAMVLGDIVALYSAVQTPEPTTDYFAFWSFSRFVHAQIPAQIYDQSALHEFQITLGTHDNLPFLYPPGILLLLWPLGLLPYVVGFALWIGSTFSLYLASLWHRRSWAWVLPTLLAAPATVMCGTLGQLGFLIAGLLIGGLRVARFRPVLAGMMLGLAAVKPQFALLIPIALLAAGLWRTLYAAAATVIALVIGSSICFGWTIWLSWAEAIPRLVHTVAGMRHLFADMPTVTGNLHLLDAGTRLTAPVQLLAAGVAAWSVWCAFRAGPSRTAVASLLTAAFLATPYALIGDLPLITGAVVLLVEDRLFAGRTFRTGELAVLGLAIWLPYLMLSCTRFPLSVAVPLLLHAMARASATPASRLSSSAVPAG